MALQRGDHDQLPKGGVLLSEAQAKEYQYKLVYGWKPERDVWSFHYGFGILGACSALSGMYVNGHYRSKLRLHHYGRITTYLPNVVIPALFSALFHNQIVSMDIMLQKTGCPACLQIRASAIQVGFSVLQPIIMAPIACFMTATHYNTYKIPLLTENPRGVFNLWRKFTKPVGNTLISIVIAQSLIAMWVTYCEAKAYYKIQTVLNENIRDRELLKT